MSKLRPQTPKSEFYQLLDQIVTNENSTKDSFDNAVNMAREQGFTDTEIAMFMHDYLKDKIPKTTLGRWTKALKPAQIEDSSSQTDPPDPNDDNKETEDTSTPENEDPKPRTPDKEDAAALTEKLDTALKTIDEKNVYILNLEKINKAQSEVKKKIETIPDTKDDCTTHSMYLKAQAIIETNKEKIEKLEERIEELDKIVFVPADKAESPPDMFQVPKDIITGGAYHKKLSPIQAVSQIKQLLNAVTFLEIGWRVIE